mgnify:CR=1 FL=1
MELYMYSQFTIANQLPLIPNALSYQKCLILGNYLMIISTIVVTSSVFITFAFDEQFSISVQIFAHIATIVFAGLLKIGYVLRCVALHGFGKRNF